jgi:putative membrane protein
VVDFGDQPLAGAAPAAVPLFAVPPGRVLASIGLSAAAWLIPLVVVAVCGVTVGLVRGDTIVPGLLPMAGAGLTAVVAGWRRIAASLNFSVAGYESAILVRHGLTELVSQTVPGDRVQAIRLRQPLTWRWKSWWTMDVNVAGYEVTATTARSVVLPVGPFDEAAQVLWYLAPRLVGPELEPMWRLALTGTGPGAGFVAAPRRARWLDPVGWRRLAYAVTPDALVLRSGFWVRTVVVVPHGRTQAVTVCDGPLRRALRLASVAIHSTVGVVVPRVDGLDAGDAGRLAWEQIRRTEAATGRR